MFYISKISVTGASAQTAVLDFNPGVNIIYGPSDTGKSYILDCINFVMGSEESRIPQDAGYDTVHVIVSVDGKNVTFSRKLDGEEIDVVSLNGNIESGKYKTGTGKKAISNIWMQILGIDPGTKVYKTVGEEKIALTIRVLYQMFYLDEDRIDAKYSILQKARENYPIAIRTRFLYLLYGKDYDDGVQHEGNTKATTRKKAVIDFIKERLKAIQDQQDSINKVEKPRSVHELQTQITGILDEIDNAESDLARNIERSRELANLIISTNDQLAESSMMENRFAVLKEQYASDVQRLTFIVEGDLHRKKLQRPVRCPFCNGELNKKQEETCAQAAAQEVEKLMPQIRDLEGATQDLHQEKERLTAELDLYEAERKEIDSYVSKELKPRISELREQLVEYTHAVEIAKEEALLSEMEESLKSEMRERQKEPASSVHFDADAHFEEAFFKQFDELLKTILKDCGYDLTQVYFDLERLDIVVNNKAKRMYGQGYRAYLNSVMGIAIREYLYKYGAYNTQLLLLDSPIMSLKEKPVKDEASIDMKHGLFQYVIDHSEAGQTIIVENEIPSTVDYSKACMIEFTKDDSNGRYGFLYGKAVR